MAGECVHQRNNAEVLREVSEAGAALQDDGLRGQRNLLCRDEVMMQRLRMFLNGQRRLNAR
jgi:hypothetical protein